MTASAAALPGGAQATALRNAHTLRILHVLDHSVPLHSGYAFRSLSILQAQRARGWDTWHITGPKQGSGSLYEEQVGDLTFYRTPTATDLRARLPVMRHRALMDSLEARLGEVVDLVRPHILHAHSPVLDAFPALALGRARGIPVVYEVRAFWEDAAVDLGTAREGGLRYRLTRAMETRALRRADAVTTICEGLRRDIVERGIPADKVTVIPNAVNLSEFQSTDEGDPALAQRFGLTRGMTLGFAGSFYAYEGLDLLLRALPRVAREAPAVRLLLLGGGPEESRLQQLSGELGLDGRVQFLGRVPHADMVGYYAMMDVMVYPRILRRLTELVTPLKPLEAMAMRKLVVASDVGGHRELIRDGWNGRLFAAGSVDALATCLIQSLQDREASQALMANGHDYVLRERTWQRSVARYEDVYKRVQDGTTRSGART